MRWVFLFLTFITFNAGASFTPGGPPASQVETSGPRWKVQFALSRPGTYSTTAAGTPVPDDTIFCYPYPSGGGGTIVEIGSGVSSLVASSKVRVAVYASDPLTLYPTTLTAQSAELDFGSGGRKSTEVSATLKADQMYYLCIRMKGGPSAHSITANSSPYWGIDVTTGEYIFGLKVAHAYGADGSFPSTFPSGATLLTQTTNTSYPLVWIRF